MSNKYEYLHVIQGNYGCAHGWEDLCFSDNRTEAFHDFIAYRDNEPEYPHRLIQRRVLKEKEKKTGLYNVVRFYRSGRRNKIIRRGVSLAEAQLHCNDPKTRKENVWFDGYTEQ